MESYRNIFKYKSAYGGFVHACKMALAREMNITMRFWSILVFGKAGEVKDIDIKLTVMNLLMEMYAKDYNYEPLSLDDMNIVNVVEISMDQITGKASVDAEVQHQEIE